MRVLIFLRHELYSGGKFKYPNLDFLARVMFYIRQQLFIDEFSLFNYYKRRTFGKSPFIPMIKVSSEERLIRSYSGMELLTERGHRDSNKERNLKDALDIQTQFVKVPETSNVSVAGRIFSIFRNDDIDHALEILKENGIETDSYTILYQEGKELIEEQHGVINPNSALIFEKPFKYTIEWLKEQGMIDPKENDEKLELIKKYFSMIPIQNA